MLCSSPAAKATSAWEAIIVESNLLVDLIGIELVSRLDDIFVLITFVLLVLFGTSKLKCGTKLLGICHVIIIL